MPADSKWDLIRRLKRLNSDDVSVGACVGASEGVNGTCVLKIRFSDDTKHTSKNRKKALKQQCISDYAWAAFLEGARKQRFARIKATKITS